MIFLLILFLLVIIMFVWVGVIFLIWLSSVCIVVDWLDSWWLFVCCFVWLVDLFIGVCGLF